MLDQLTNLVKEYAGDTIITNPAIPNENNEEAVQLASSSIFRGLQTSISSGNLADVQNLFNGGENDVAHSAITQNIKGDFVTSLVQKFGLDHGKAGQIASALIPIVLSKFIKKTNDPNDGSFDLSSILGSLTGGGNISDILGKLTGGGDDKSGGGLMDKVKGMFN